MFRNKVVIILSIKNKEQKCLDVKLEITILNHPSSC